MVDIVQIDAQIKYWRGDATALVECLRSGHQLDQGTRDMVADILEGKFKKKRGAKTQHNLPVYAVREYYRLSKEELNAEDGTAGHGAACEAVATMFDTTADVVDKIIYPRSGRSR